MLAHASRQPTPWLIFDVGRKKMMCSRYKCRADFPKRIASLLSSLGLTVVEGEWLAKKPSSSTEFGYRVGDGACSVVVTGGTLPDGVIGFEVTSTPDMKFWLRSKRRALCERVRIAVISGGAELWNDHPDK